MHDPESEKEQDIQDNGEGEGDSPKA